MQDRDKLAHNYFFKRASELIKSSPFLSLLVKGITYRTSGAMNPRSNTAHSEGTFTGPFPGCLVRNRSDETGKEMTEVLLAGYGAKVDLHKRLQYPSCVKGNSSTHLPTRMADVCCIITSL